ncbi:MAG: hypothetical protein R3B93_08965 [Bacteroidia bacterium]
MFKNYCIEDTKGNYLTPNLPLNDPNYRRGRGRVISVRTQSAGLKGYHASIQILDLDPVSGQYGNCTKENGDNLILYNVLIPYSSIPSNHPQMGGGSAGGPELEYEIILKIDYTDIHSYQFNHILVGAVIIKSLP